jgi:hypothetical protein
MINLLESAFADATPLWREIRIVRESIVGGRHDDSLPDVYPAALSMGLGGDWNVERYRSIYRGLRCSRWKVVPSLFRAGSNGSAADVRARWRRTSEFVAAVRTKFPELTGDQCFAVAQYYSARDEAETLTDLIDVTWGPLVALFFATFNGVNGVNGVNGGLGGVDYIGVSEWQRLVANRRGDPGAIRVVEVSRGAAYSPAAGAVPESTRPRSVRTLSFYRIWFR